MANSIQQVQKSNLDFPWPSLPLTSWEDTYTLLRLWTQIVGKIRLTLSPYINHWWQVPLYVTSRGLTTSAIPYGLRNFQISFDFLDGQLLIESSDGNTQTITLVSGSVVEFYQQVMEKLKALDIDVQIVTMPQEIEDAIPFNLDRRYMTYDPEAAKRFWRILIQAERLMTVFRSRFTGKCSPVHLFWGNLDLAVTRFSGRRAPVHPGGIPNVSDRVMQEAYSHEVSSCGFWAGGGVVAEPVFYAYAYPEPEGFRDYPVLSPAFYSSEMQEFILPYEAVRQADDPDALVLNFFQNTYEAAANLADWDRVALERS